MNCLSFEQQVKNIIEGKYIPSFYYITKSATFSLRVSEPFDNLIVQIVQEHAEHPETLLVHVTIHTLNFFLILASHNELSNFNSSKNK